MRKHNEILRIQAGSTAYGTSLDDNGDRDEISIIVETPDEVFGLSKEGFHTKMDRTKPEGVRSGPGDLDLTIYSLRTFIKLCCDGNPSMMAALWSPVLSTSNEGGYLLGIRKEFVGRHVIPRYRGYMKGQGLRLLGLKGSGHGKRGGGRREELIEAHGWDTKYAMHAARLGFQCIELLQTEHLELPLEPDNPTRSWLLALRRGEVPFDEWWDVCIDLDMKMESLIDDDEYPEKANTDRIIEVSSRIHAFAWGWSY